MNRQFDAHEMERRDRERAIIHESGHAVVAEHYGLLDNACIYREGDPDLLNRAWVGQTKSLGLVCKIDPSGQPTVKIVGSPLKFAAISFGGEVAEKVAETKEAGGEVCALDVARETFAAFIDRMPDDFSDTDIAGILKTPFQWRAAKLAAEIVVRKWERLLEIAEVLRVTEFYSPPFNPRDVIRLPGKAVAK